MKKQKQEKEILKKMGLSEEDKFDSGIEVKDVSRNKKTKKEVKKEVKKEESDLPLKYQCPQCGKMLPTRKGNCPKCGYSGYVPLTKKQLFIIRSIIFVILMAIFLYIYLK